MIHNQETVATLYYDGFSRKPSPGLFASSLLALSHVSSRIYLALVPELYRDLTFCAVSEWALNVLDIDSFFVRHGSSRASSHLRHTRNLHIEAPIHLARLNRCAYYSIFRSVGLSQWRLGTCIPMGVLNQGGYLSRHQKSLKRLSLVTDGTCPQTSNHLDGLSELSCLKELEWEGIQHPAEVHSLEQCIRQNLSHLTCLSISFVPSSNAHNLCWDVLGLQWPSPSLWGGTKTLSPLSTLLLSKVTLLSNLSPSDSLIFENLRVLKLRDCPNQLQLLGNLSRCQIPMRLEHFESCLDFQLQDPVGDHDFSAFVDFLLSFHGLQRLHLRLSNLPSTESRIQDVIRHHQSTLETIIYHERQLAPLDDDGLFEEIRDVLPEWIPRLSTIIIPHKVTALALCAAPSSVKLFLPSASRHSRLQLLHLRFSGCERIHRNIRQEILTHLCEKQTNSLRVDYLSQYGQASASLPSTDCDYDSLFDDIFEALPIDDTVAQDATIDCSAGRTEAEEFLSFAEWAFGPLGIPSLQVLALGDFSHEERYQEQQFLIRRVDPSRVRGQNGVLGCFTNNVQSGPCFEPAVTSDIRTWEALSFDGLQFLSACPGGGLMESPYEM
ncbi:unnamed protein product [Penicillium salamii]|nr:unnamed protein product [Penicillium salamii]CAG8380901.1 unnamed protein product [Penicillium salamii]